MMSYEPIPCYECGAEAEAPCKLSCKLTDPNTELCAVCNGQGVADTDEGNLRLCTNCSGVGVVTLPTSEP